MAVFTVPAVREDDALRAVRAAADMRAALAELNEELERRYGVTLQTHTGVNTGQVIAGDPARGGGFVSGDAVNVAARLQQAATPGEILIGERTLELVSQAVTVEPVPPLGAQGQEPAGPCLQASRGRRGAGGRRAGADLAARRPRPRAAASPGCLPGDDRPPQRRAAHDRRPRRRRQVAARHRLRGVRPRAGRGRGRALPVLRRGARVLAAARGRHGGRGQRRRRRPRRGAVRARARAGGRRRRGCDRGARRGRRGVVGVGCHAAGDLLGVRTPVGGGRVRASAGGRPRGRPLGGARPPRPDRARRGVAGGRAGAHRRARPTRPPRRQARLRRRRTAAGAGAARRRRQRPARRAPARGRRRDRGTDADGVRARRGQSAVRRGARAHARRRASAGARRLGPLRRALVAALAAADHPCAARRPHRPPRAGRACGARRRRGDRQLVRPRRPARAGRRGRPRGPRRAAAGTRAQAADRGRRRTPLGRPDLQLHPGAGSRRRLRGHAQGASRRSPRALRRLAGAHRR